MSEPTYIIIQRADGRFIIVDAFTREVLEDAQGWYKFKGGKAKLDAAEIPG